MGKENYTKQIEELNARLEELTKQQETLMKELDEKKYLVVGKEEAAKKIQDFICNKATAVGEECKGIVRINKIIDEYLTGKPGAEFMLNGAPLGAINYFLQKFESHCLADAEMVDSIYATLDQALASAKEDTDNYNEIDCALKQVRQQIQAAEMGLSFAEEKEKQAEAKTEEEK